MHNQQISRNKHVDEIIEQIVQFSKGQAEAPDYKNMSDILQQTKKIIVEQPAFLDLSAPIEVVGSIHGHLQGLVKLMDFIGWPQQKSYLFLGNYVDIGPHSLETIMLLLLLKLKYPNAFFLLRGSHECAHMNNIYGFYAECKMKQQIPLWEIICDIFAFMPYAAVVDQKIFCVSGGIGPDIQDIRQIEKLGRGIRLLDHGPACNLIWSDPDQIEEGFSNNLQGYGVVYGRDALNRFMTINSLQLICRSKQALQNGHQFMFNKRLINLFSAPNFKGKFQNSASVLSISNNLVCKVKTYQPKRVKITAASLIN